MRADRARGLPLALSNAAAAIAAPRRLLSDRRRPIAVHDYVACADATASTAADREPCIGLRLSPILSIVMLGERIRWRRALGMALTLCGTLLVIWNPNGVTISNGLIFVVLSSAAGSLGAILMKQIKGVQARQFQAWAGLSAILPLGLASALFESGQVSTTLAGGLKLLGCVAFSALVVSVIAQDGALLADQPLRGEYDRAAYPDVAGLHRRARRVAAWRSARIPLRSHSLAC